MGIHGDCGLLKLRVRGELYATLCGGLFCAAEESSDGVVARLIAGVADVEGCGDATCDDVARAG